MNSKAINFIKNFSYTISSNLISMLITALIILVIPKLISFDDYGYWQLYLFYSSYVGLFHFGWIEGIYLRYGGANYKELDNKLFFSQFIMFVFFQLILMFIFLTIAYFFITNNEKVFIFSMITFYMFITNTSYMLIYILQTTNRIKDFALITIIDRIIYCCLIISLISFSLVDYKLFIVADLVGKTFGLIYAMYACRNIVFNKLSTFYFTFKEIIENISIGMKILFANIASMLIIGFVRIGIEKTWNVATFGKISLILSISNFLMLFINAIGLIMFPLLKRTNIKNLPYLYILIRNLLIPLLLGCLLLFYPVKILLTLWLPEYSGSFIYMVMLFPILVFEGKTALLLNTYFKTMRLEKLIFKINIVSLILSIMLTLVFTSIFMNLTLTILSIVITLAFRSALGEVYLLRKLGVKFFKDIFWELFIITCFVLTGWYLEPFLAFIIYLLLYTLYFIFKKEDVYNSINNLKELSKLN